MLASLDLSDIPNDKLKKLKNDITKSLRVLEMNSFNMSTNPERNEKNAKLISSVHPRITTFSDCLQLVSSEKEGRFVTAAREVQVGEVVVDEEALQVQHTSYYRQFVILHLRSLCLPDGGESSQVPVPL